MGPGDVAHSVDQDHHHQAENETIQGSVTPPIIFRLTTTNVQPSNIIIYVPYISAIFNQKEKKIELIFIGHEKKKKKTSLWRCKSDPEKCNKS